MAEFQERVIHINQYLVKLNMPKEFRKKVKRYLKYIMYNKRQFKMEECEVLDMLNENLRIELIVHLNGKMLHDSTLFQFFNLTFLSQLTFILKRDTFTIEEQIFDEDLVGDKMHYITKGNAILIHKKTATFIAEVSIDTFIGEVSFFTGKPRKASARSKNFTEVLTLYLSDFYEAARDHPRQLELFHNIREVLTTTGDLQLIGTQCYICKRTGHMATECSEFEKVRGNLREAWLKRMQEQTQAVGRGGSLKTRLLRKDFDLSELFGEQEEENERESIVEMFSKLEKRYKKEERELMGKE